MSCSIDGNLFFISHTNLKQKIDFNHIYNLGKDRFYICDKNDLILVDILFGLNEIFLRYKNYGLTCSFSEDLFFYVNNHSINL